MVAWRVAKSLDVLLAQFNAACPNRSKASDGSIGNAEHAARTSDHNPWVDIPGESANAVTARDYTHDPAHGMDIGKITDELVATRDPRIKYVIANNMICESHGRTPWKWVAYHGSNEHRHHFHLSVMSDARLFDGTAPWQLPMFGGHAAPPAVNPPLMPSGRRMLMLTSPHMVGADVKALQERLNRDYSGYSSLGLDSDFGRAVDTVVREFQKRSHMTVDGKVGPATLAALHL